MSEKKSYLDELHKKEQLAENRRQKVIESHKCYRCIWGRFLENKYYCMFFRCIGKR